MGSEVRFASQPDETEEAVESAAEFIYWRSGVRLSDDTKKRLAKAEKDVLSGKSPRINTIELTDDMTSAVVDRLATLTDAEIQAATAP